MKLVPKQIILTESAMAVIVDEARASADGTETGGILLGAAERDAIVVRRAGRPGPGAIRRPDFFQRDLRHAQSYADRAFALDRSIWVGEWHTHLHAPPRPSTLDLTTYQNLLSDPELIFEYFVAIILTDNRIDWLTPQFTAWIVTPRGACAVPAHKHAQDGGEKQPTVGVGVCPTLNATGCVPSRITDFLPHS